jgi:hypothetical protein
MTTEIQEQEIAFDQAKAEEDLTAPVGVGADEPQSKEEADVIDILQPKSDPRAWTIGTGDYERTYIQRPLSFFAKMQWFSLVGEVLDKALSGENKMSMNSLLSTPGRGGALSIADFRDADTFMQAIGKLLSYAPDFMLDSYVIWLGVPGQEKESAKLIMSLPEEDGGLSDEHGIEIIEVFIDQNYDALDDFFRKRIGELRNRVEARQKTAKEKREAKASRR